MAAVTVEVLDADITTLELDAITNAANTRLAHGGGVAGAIVRAGGREIQRESDELAPIELGQAVHTGAGRLPSRWVIHAATMHPGGSTDADTIAAATASALLCAQRLGARSLGLVAFGTGVGGFPLDQAAEIEVRELCSHLRGHSQLQQIVFCVRGQDALGAFQAALTRAREIGDLG